MNETAPGSEKCLTTEESQELQAAWSGLQAALRPLGELVQRATDIDCDELHDTFLNVSDDFDKVEHLIMRAKQIRLIRAGHIHAEGS